MANKKYRLDKTVTITMKGLAALIASCLILGAMMATIIVWIAAIAIIVGASWLVSSSPFIKERRFLSSKKKPRLKVISNKTGAR